MQPTYLPWLGFFDLIRNSDVFVVYDHVQFEKQSWQQRNRIRDKNGIIMLTVPVHYAKGLDRSIKDVRIDHKSKALQKHLMSIRMAYSKSLNFDRFFPELEQLYSAPHETLISLNMALIGFGMKHLGITRDLLYSSNLHVQGHRVEALIDICKKLGADHYLSPVGSKDYIDQNNLFAGNDISLSYQEFNHPVYQQIDQREFISHLSFIDYLFRVDAEESKMFGVSKNKLAIK
jgi:hypothetical protein